MKIATVAQLQSMSMLTSAWIYIDYAASIEREYFLRIGSYKRRSRNPRNSLPGGMLIDAEAVNLPGRAPSNSWNCTALELYTTSEVFWKCCTFLQRRVRWRVKHRTKIFVRSNVRTQNTDQTCFAACNRLTLQCIENPANGHQGPLSFRKGDPASSFFRWHRNQLGMMLTAPSQSSNPL